MLFKKQHTSKSRNVESGSLMTTLSLIQFQAATPSPSSDKLDFSPGVSEKTQTPTMAPENVTEGGITLLSTNTVSPEPMQQFTPPATDAKAGNVLT